MDRLLAPFVYKHVWSLFKSLYLQSNWLFDKQSQSIPVTKCVDLVKPPNDYNNKKLVTCKSYMNISNTLIVEFC